MADDLSITNRFIIPGSELQMSASLSGGAGGQHASPHSHRKVQSLQMLLSFSITGQGALHSVTSVRKTDGKRSKPCDRTTKSKETRISQRTTLAFLLRVRGHEN